MTANVGTVDRALRLILGVVLLAAPFLSGMALFNSTIATVIAVVVGVVMIAVATLRVCPIYSILGVKTCKT